MHFYIKIITFSLKFFLLKNEDNNLSYVLKIYQAFLLVVTSSNLQVQKNSNNSKYLARDFSR